MKHQPSTEQFPIGFYHLHDNVALNFQLNRFLPCARLEDFLSAASKIRNLQDWKREMLQLAEQTEAEGRIQNAAAAYRAAEFFIVPGDPDKEKAYQRFLALFEQLTEETEFERRDVPFQGKSLPTMHLPLEHPKGTTVMHVGFDSFKEEFFPAAVFFSPSGLPSNPVRRSWTRSRAQAPRIAHDRRVVIAGLRGTRCLRYPSPFLSRNIARWVSRATRVGVGTAYKTRCCVGRHV